MPPKPTTGDERLIAAYHEAALRIERLLQQATPRNRRTIMRQINAVLAELETLSSEYVHQELPARFKEGSEEAVRLLTKDLESIDTSFSGIHKEAIQALAEDASMKFAGTIENARRESQSLLTKIQKQKVIGSLIVSEIEGASNPAQRVTEVLQEERVTGLRTSNNRRITLENYAETLVNALLGEAHNTGAATRYAVNGVGFVRVIEKETACPICSPMDDKIVSLADPRLLPIYHPHCRGGIAPFLGEPEDPIMSIDDARIPEKTRAAMLRKG